MNLNGAERRSGPCQMQTLTSTDGPSSSILQSPFVLPSKKNNHRPSRHLHPFFSGNHLERQTKRRTYVSAKRRFSNESVNLFAQNDGMLYYGWSQDHCQCQSFQVYPTESVLGFQGVMLSQFHSNLKPYNFGEHHIRPILLRKAFIILRQVSRHHCTHSSDVIIIHYTNSIGISNAVATVAMQDGHPSWNRDTLLWLQNTFHMSTHKHHFFNWTFKKTVSSDFVNIISCITDCERYES